MFSSLNDLAIVVCANVISQLKVQPVLSWTIDLLKNKNIEKFSLVKICDGDSEIFRIWSTCCFFSFLIQFIVVIKL